MFCNLYGDVEINGQLLCGFGQQNRDNLKENKEEQGQCVLFVQYREA